MRKTGLNLTGILTGIPEGTNKPFGKYVYQKTVAGHGNIADDDTNRMQVRRWVQGTLRNTQAQQIFRKRFALGIGNWQAKSEQEKELWRAQSAELKLNRFQGFIRAWMREKNITQLSTWDAGRTSWDNSLTSWPLPEGDVWDSGRTSWDSGSTIFDI